MEESEIRRPDAAIIDRLIINNDFVRNSRTQFCSKDEDDDFVKRALEESEADFEFQFAILESRRMAKEKEERATHFAGFLSKIRRFAKIDKSNESFYLKLIEYIELHERDGVEIVNVSRDFYMKFTRTMDNMRITPEEKSRLYQLIRL